MSRVLLLGVSDEDRPSALKYVPWAKQRLRRLVDKGFRGTRRYKVPEGFLVLLDAGGKVVKILPDATLRHYWYVDGGEIIAADGEVVLRGSRARKMATGLEARPFAALQVLFGAGANAAFWLLGQRQFAANTVYLKSDNTLVVDRARFAARRASVPADQLAEFDALGVALAGVMGTVVAPDASVVNTLPASGSSGSFPAPFQANTPTLADEGLGLSGSSTTYTGSGPVFTEPRDHEGEWTYTVEHVAATFAHADVYNYSTPPAGKMYYLCTSYSLTHDKLVRRYRRTVNGLELLGGRTLLPVAVGVGTHHIQDNDYPTSWSQSYSLPVLLFSTWGWADYSNTTKFSAGDLRYEYTEPSTTIRALIGVSTPHISSSQPTGTWTYPTDGTVYNIFTDPISGYVYTTRWNGQITVVSGSNTLVDVTNTPTAWSGLFGSVDVYVDVAQTTSITGVLDAVSATVLGLVQNASVTTGYWKDPLTNEAYLAYTTPDLVVDPNVAPINQLTKATYNPVSGAYLLQKPPGPGVSATRYTLRNAWLDETDPTLAAEIMTAYLQTFEYFVDLNHLPKEWVIGSGVSGITTDLVF